MKINRNKWQSDFEKELDKAEKRQLSKVKNYYITEYNKGVASFLAEGQTNFQLLFDSKDLQKIYRDLYLDIGLQFAKWYAKNYDKYLSKGINPSEYVGEWTNKFAAFGSAVGAQRVTLVSGTAKETLIKITQNLIRDPEFMTLGNTEKGRILKSQFNRYSQYQSERLVRTEATNAANFATMESATTIFPGAQMQKEWIASFDDRTRDTHAEVGASEPIPYNDAFMVGGNFLMYPGDPSGPASEVINCRCSVAPFPVRGAQANTEITDISFGIGGANTTGFGLVDVASAISSVLVGAAENVVDVAAKTVIEAKKMLTDLFENNGFKINKTSMARSLGVEQYNQRFNKLNELFNTYNFGREGNSIRSIILNNKSTGGSYGYIKSGMLKGDLFELNLGDKTGSYLERTFNLFTNKFDRRFKSAINAENNHLATVVHEMGHVLTRSSLSSEGDFFIKLRELQKEYRAELLKNYTDLNYKSYNKIFMGRYGNTNIDEFLAEGFTEYNLNSTPSKYARLIGDLVNKYYKK
tara:strand:+ start:1490 stop:3061 length:1572 start_codon:yes stop_codon:yes gene_type:complete